MLTLETAVQPHPHDYDPQTGRCRVCGITEAQELSGEHGPAEGGPVQMPPVPADLKIPKHSSPSSELAAFVKEADDYQTDSRQWPDPTEPRPSGIPKSQGCTCQAGHKLDCPVHGLHPTEADRDFSWSVPEGSPVGYPQDAPRNWQRPYASVSINSKERPSLPGTSEPSSPPTAITFRGHYDCPSCGQGYVANGHKGWTAVNNGHYDPRGPRWSCANCNLDFEPASTRPQPKGTQFKAPDPEKRENGEQDPGIDKRELVQYSGVQPIDPMTCSTCGSHAMTEPKLVGNKHMQVCTQCGRTRIVPSTHPVVKVYNDPMQTEYPSLLNEVGPQRPMWSFSKSSGNTATPHFHPWTGKPCYCPYGKPKPKRPKSRLGSAAIRQLVNQNPKHLRNEHGADLLNYLHEQISGRPYEQDGPDLQGTLPGLEGMVPWISSQFKRGNLGFYPGDRRGRGAGIHTSVPNVPMYDPNRGVTNLNWPRAPLTTWTNWFNARQHPLRQGRNIMGMDPSEVTGVASEHNHAVQDELKRERLLDDVANTGQIVHRFHNGYQVRQLDPGNDQEMESAALGHCIGNEDQPYHNANANGQIVIHSLRDPEGWPHATWHHHTEDNSLAHIQGKSGDPRQDYRDMISEFNHSKGWSDKETGERDYDHDADPYFMVPSANTANDYANYFHPSSDNDQFLREAADNFGANVGDNSEIEADDPDFNGIVHDLADHANYANSSYHNQLLREIFETAHYNNYHMPPLQGAINQAYRLHPDYYPTLNHQWEQYKSDNTDHENPNPLTGEGDMQPYYAFGQTFREQHPERNWPDLPPPAPVQPQPDAEHVGSVSVVADGGFVFGCLESHRSAPLRPSRLADSESSYSWLSGAQNGSFALVAHAAEPEAKQVPETDGREKPDDHKDESKHAFTFVDGFVARIADLTSAFKFASEVDDDLVTYSAKLTESAIEPSVMWHVAPTATHTAFSMLSERPQGPQTLSESAPGAFPFLIESGPQNGSSRTGGNEESYQDLLRLLRPDALPFKEKPNAAWERAREEFEREREIERQKWLADPTGMERAVWEKYRTNPSGHDMLEAEHVPLEHMHQFSELDRRPGGEHQNSTPERWEALKDDIRQHGFMGALTLAYNQDNGMAHLSEGNHRYRIATELGLSHVPVRVMRDNRSSPVQVPVQIKPRPEWADQHGTPLPGVEGRWHIPPVFSPSDIGLPTLQPGQNPSTFHENPSTLGENPSTLSNPLPKSLPQARQTNTCQAGLQAIQSTSNKNLANSSHFDFKSSRCKSLSQLASSAVGPVHNPTDDKSNGNKVHSNGNNKLHWQFLSENFDFSDTPPEGHKFVYYPGSDQGIAKWSNPQNKVFHTDLMDELKADDDLSHPEPYLGVMDRQGKAEVFHKTVWPEHQDDLLNFLKQHHPDAQLVSGYNHGWKMASRYSQQTDGSPHTPHSHRGSHPQHDVGQQLVTQSHVQSSSQELQRQLRASWLYLSRVSDSDTSVARTGTEPSVMEGIPWLFGHKRPHRYNRKSFSKGVVPNAGSKAGPGSNGSPFVFGSESEVDFKISGGQLWDFERAKTATETLPQQQRRWEQLTPMTPSTPVHRLENGYTVHEHHSPDSINAVGSFMRNCWQGPNVAKHFAEQKAAGFGYQSLHDSQGLPRAAFYVHTNPWSRESPQIKMALGPRNHPLDAFHNDLISEYAQANGYQFKRPECNGYTDSRGDVVHDGDTCPVHEGEGPLTGTLGEPVHASWHFANNNLNWTPGNYGKGFVTRDGEVHHWNLVGGCPDGCQIEPNDCCPHGYESDEAGEMDGHPHHDEYMHDHGLDDYSSVHWIDPEGIVNGLSNNPKEHNDLFMASHPEFSPIERGDRWNFSHVKTSQHQLNWTPGNYGKGLIMENGDIHHWNTNATPERVQQRTDSTGVNPMVAGGLEGAPHHGSYMLLNGLVGKHYPFWINPNGNFQEGLGRVNPQNIQDFANSHPQLKYEVDGWNFSKVLSGTTPWTVRQYNNSDDRFPGEHHASRSFLVDRPNRLIHLGWGDSLHHQLFNAGATGERGYTVPNPGNLNSNVVLTGNDNNYAQEGPEIANAIGNHLGIPHEFQTDPTFNFAKTAGVDPNSGYKVVILGDGEVRYWPRSQVKFHAQGLERDGISQENVAHYLDVDEEGGIRHAGTGEAFPARRATPADTDTAINQIKKAIPGTQIATGPKWNFSKVATDVFHAQNSHSHFDEYKGEVPDRGTDKPIIHDKKNDALYIGQQGTHHADVVDEFKLNHILDPKSEHFDPFDWTSQEDAPRDAGLSYGLIRPSIVSGEPGLSEWGVGSISGHPGAASALRDMGVNVDEPGGDELFRFTKAEDSIPHETEETPQDNSQQDSISRLEAVVAKLAAKLEEKPVEEKKPRKLIIKRDENGKMSSIEEI